MQKNDLLSYQGSIVRVLEVKRGRALIIDCLKDEMPHFVPSDEIEGMPPTSLNNLCNITSMHISLIGDLSEAEKRVMYERFAAIVNVLPYLENVRKRSEMIHRSAELFEVSERTIRNYLLMFLKYQDKAVLVPPRNSSNRELTQDQKNMRWALNKAFYTERKGSLNDAYTYLLKEKYCDENGNLLAAYPSFYQFRYFYRKTKMYQKYYISRNGLKDYEKNHRPLLGDGVQSFANAVGMGMLDSTIADIFLVNDEGKLIGRPIITACIDAFSYYCCGFTVTLEGGIYSLSELMKQVAEDKVNYCKSLGIPIYEEEWFGGFIPSILVTDRGTEYMGDTFEQIAELGVKIINLESYRAELKGVVEVFFYIIQKLFKSELKGKGVIQTDFQQRGAHDYRKDACLTLKEFETILIRCVLYYNNRWLIQSFPSTDLMIASKVPPIPQKLWKWKEEHGQANLIPMTKNQLEKTLLPRTIGKFTRRGLIVTKLRYVNKKYTEMYLKGGKVTVAYSPTNASKVWLIEDGEYIPFELIESRFQGKSSNEIEEMRSEQKQIIDEYREAQIKGKIDLVTHIETIAHNGHQGEVDIKGIRLARQKEQSKERRKKEQHESY